MTPAERSSPDIIDKSRASRIARGSGRRSKDVRDLVDRFGQMREMMASLGSGGGMLSRVPGLGRLAGAGGIDPSMLAGPTAGKSAKTEQRSRSRQKGKRKQARKARRKNRKR